MEGLKEKKYQGGFRSDGVDVRRVKRSEFGLELKLGLICVGIIHVLRIVSIVLLVHI